jgi:hypothetical protein
MISNLKLKQPTSLVCITFLTHYLCSLGDEIRAKYHFLSRFDPIERGSIATSVECVKWCHPNVVLVTIVVGKLSQGQTFVLAALMVQYTCSKHIF